MRYEFNPDWKESISFSVSINEPEDEINRDSVGTVVSRLAHIPIEVKTKKRYNCQCICTGETIKK